MLRPQRSAPRREPGPLRVLYVQPAALFGGAERQAATTIPWLRRLGVDVVALAGPGDIIGEWFEHRGVDDFVHSRSFPGGWPKQRGLGKLTLPRRYARCMRDTRRQIEAIAIERDIDVIFAALPFSWVSATPVARKLGIPIVWRAGGTEIGASLRAILAAWATRWKPDLLVCNGGAVARTYGPLVRAPLVIVPNGVDTSEFFPRRGRRSGAARVTVGFAARLVPQKRPEDFIRLAARIGAQLPDVAFLAGGEGSMRAHYQGVAAHERADNLTFLGYVADMKSFYDQCDVFVLPSRSEGCPNVVLEAMACGSGIVVSDASGTREVVREGIEGFIYPIGDLDGLTRATLQMLTNEPLRQGLAQRALTRVTTSFAADVCARRTAELLYALAVPRGVERPGAVEETGVDSPPAELDRRASMPSAG